MPKKTDKICSSTWVLSGIFALATLMGVLAFFKYVKTETSVKQGRVFLQERGKSLDLHGCVAELLAWSAGCEGIKSVCDASAPILMESCLKSQDRTEECVQKKTLRMDSTFGYRDCAAISKTKAARKVCGNAYRAFDSYCKTRIIVGQK